MPATFEASVQVALDGLCPDCPLRNMCGQIEIARMEADAVFDKDPIAATENDIEGQMAAIEADAASDIVMAGVYRARKGCEGPETHEKTCSCGNDKSCMALEAVVELINQ